MSFFEDASLVYIPAAIKNGKTYSIKPTDGTGDLTFTRASSATRVGPNGYIEKVRENLQLYSEDFSNGVYVKQNVTLTASQSDPLGGTGATSFKETTANDLHRFYYAFFGPSVSGYYTNSVYVKDDGRGAVLFGVNSVGESFVFTFATATISNVTGTPFAYSATDAGNGWYRLSITFFVASAFNFCFVQGWNGSTSSYAGDTSKGFFAFGSQLELSDFGPTQYIKTEAAAVSVGPVSGTPRLDYLGSDCGRLLLEPQRSNIAAYSEQFDNAAGWILYNGTQVANTTETIDPSGYYGAEKVIMGGTNSATYRKSIGGLTNGDTYTFSLYIKQGSGVTAFLDICDSSGSVDITPTNEWVRYTKTGVWNTSLPFVDIELRGTSGSYCYIWGAQLEAGAYATSYIPTLGTAVTRVADKAEKTSASGIIGQTEGTIYWEVEIFTAQNVGAEDILVIDNGVATNLLYISKSFTNNSLIADMYVSSVRQAFFQTSALSLGIHKAAIAYANNNTAFFVDGVQVGTTDTSCSVPAMNRIQLGNGVLGPSINKTAQLLVFPTRLSDSQLAELTTL